MDTAIRFQRVLPQLWRGDITPAERVYIYGTESDGYWTSLVTAAQVTGEGEQAEMVLESGTYIGPFDSLDDALGYYQVPA